jgi:IPT/TIG domain
VPNITGANQYIEVPPVVPRVGGVLSVANLVPASGHALIGAEFQSDACAVGGIIEDFCEMDATIGQCVNTPVVNPPTAVTPGAPGSFTGRIPNNLSELQAIGALGQTVAWDRDEYVVLLDGAKVTWDGDSWEYWVAEHDSGGIADPHITALVPNTLPASAGSTLITINGSDFLDGAVVEVAQQARPTTFVSGSKLTIMYDPLAAGTVNFTVRNPNAEESNSYPFYISGGATGDGDPDITTVTPSTLPATAGPTLITVTGTDFVAGSVIEVGAAALATTFVNATTLTTTFDPSTPGVKLITVRNPNDEESNSFPFVVTSVALFNPGDVTIDDVKAYINALPDAGDNHPETQRVLDAERAGQARITLINWLDAKEGMV